jgi:hypothetical protein
MQRVAAQDFDRHDSPDAFEEREGERERNNGLPDAHVLRSGLRCVFYRAGWREKPKFAGPESYFVSVQVTNAAGRSSNIAKRQFIHETTA